MHEVLSDVLTLCFGLSSGPEIPFLKRFRVTWDTFNSHAMPQSRYLTDYCIGVCANIPYCTANKETP